jgi:hypothetical protein
MICHLSPHQDIHDDIRFAAYRTAVKMRDLQVFTRSMSTALVYF